MSFFNLEKLIFIVLKIQHQYLEIKLDNIINL